MGKIGQYQPRENLKKYSLPMDKPFKGHPYYTEKVWSVQELINKKLNKLANQLDDLYPQLKETVSMNLKVTIEKNLEILNKDLELMQNEMKKNPFSFNTDKLKTNFKLITEMKDVCTLLQSTKSYENEFKKLSKIKHTLHQLEHLIQPTKFEKSLEESREKIQKTNPAEKEKKQAGDNKKETKEKTMATLVSKKAKSAKKTVKSKQLDSKAPKKNKTPVKKVVKKVAKPKVTAKPQKTTKTRTSAKVTASTKPKKVLKAKPKTTVKSPAVRKKKSAS